MWLAQQPVQRLGPQALSYMRGAVDVTPWFAEGSGADRVLVSIVDYGGSASVSDVYLHVMGPHASAAVKGVEIEAMQPR